MCTGIVRSKAVFSHPSPVLVRRSDDVNHLFEPGRPYTNDPWWKIPVGCLVLVVLVACAGFGILWLVMSSFRHRDPYQKAGSRAHAEPFVVTQLDEPIRPGWFVTGELEVSGSTGQAKLQIPLKGPKNHGTLDLEADLLEGVWHFRGLEFQAGGSD